ncbi:MAG: hypothetical protein WKF66_13775 [Pedobacter sp.]
MIFIPAIKFSGDHSLSAQITELLDIHSAYTFSHFLATLDALGKIHNIRVPFILDGLNEAIDKNGHLNKRLRLDIGSIEAEILNYGNIVLLTTCRPSYQAAIWGNADRDNDRFHSLYGFTNITDKKKLINRYFKEYKIQADLSFLSLEKFTKPLYLKMFCESVNPNRDKVISLTLGYDSIYTIFDLFLERCNQNIYQRLLSYGKIAPIKKYQKLASQVMQKLGKLLWEQPSRGIEIETLIEIADGSTNVDYQHSVAKALFDEELLLIRNWQDGKDLAYLTYDMIAGYFIARHLIDEGITDFKKFFLNQSDTRLFSEKYNELHPNHEDILAALLSMLPIKKGTFVHDMLGRPPHQNPKTNGLFGRSILTMILLSPEYISPAQVQLVRDLAKRPQNLTLLLRGSEGVRFVSDHPFNFTFWDQILLGLPMNTRDIYWSEYLRECDEEQTIEFVAELKDLQQLSEHTQEQYTKMRLVADYLSWTLTSTMPSLKQLASDGLFEFGLRYPGIVFERYLYCASINDPTVFEWMSSILYNVLTTLLKLNQPLATELLTEIYDFISTNVLHANGLHATNHLLTRNYNYSIMRLLERRSGESIRKHQSEELKGSFVKLGITNWQEEIDRNENQYRDGNSLIDYYFNKNKMPQIMLGKGSEYNRTPEFKQTQAKLRWRAYQLGYDFGLFGDIDKSIARFSRFGEENQHTYRYADKYIEIAHLEYCGYLEGMGKFRNHEDSGYIRTFEPKHDPDLLFENTDVQANKRYVTRNFIDSKIHLKKYCNDHSVPDVMEYLTIERLGERTGDFVLLNGDISQIDESNERQIFVLMDVVFVKNKNLKRAREAFAHPTAVGRGPEHKPTVRHALRNEIPDADTIPHNEFTTWNYSLKDQAQEIKYSTISLYRKGKKLAEKQADRIWKLILNSSHFMALPRKMLYGVPRVMISFSSDQDDDYEKALNNMGIEIREETEIVTEQRPVTQKLDVFIPVVDIEGEHYVCKNIIDSAKLRTKAGSTDLFDNNRNLRAFTHTARVKYRDGEEFTYLDKSILESYLKENSLTMFWLIWGERDFYPENGDWDKDPKTMAKREWVRFYKATEYK